MRSVQKAKALYALSFSAAAAIGFSVKTASAATLQMFYNGGGNGNTNLGTVNAIKFGTSSALTAATAGTSLAINPTASAVTISIPVGDYIEFGINALLTDNTNAVPAPTFATSGGGGSGESTGPTNLGLSELSLRVISSDADGTTLQPLTTALRDTFNGVPAYNSTALLHKNLITSSSDPGDAEPGNGDVGDHVPIKPLENISADPTTNAGAISLGQFAAGSTNGSGTTAGFNDLLYQALVPGTVTLSPVAISGATQYWSYNGGKVTTGNTGNIYSPTYFTNPGDSLGANDMGGLPRLVVSIYSDMPPSPAHTLISLSTAVPTYYGSFLGTLNMVGGNGTYKLAQLNPISGPTGYIEASGWNPATDKEIFAIDVTGESNMQALVNAINDGDDTTPASTTVIASTTFDGLPGVSGPDPFPSTYNLFLLANPTYAGNPDYLGIDFSAADDSNLSGVSFSAIAAVPEPTSLGLLALSGLGLMVRRQRSSA